MPTRQSKIKCATVICHVASCAATAIVAVTHEPAYALLIPLATSPHAEAVVKIVHYWFDKK